MIINKIVFKESLKKTSNKIELRTHNIIAQPMNPL